MTASITVQATVNANINKVWQYFNQPLHITKWNFAHESWHSPHAESDFRETGKFSYRMEAKDKSFGFDFAGSFDEIKAPELLRYTIGDGRKVTVRFNKIDDNTTEVVETFEAETQNPTEMQQQGWQAILNNFKTYAEAA